MKKYILILLFFALVTNWDNVTGFFGITGNKYTVGNYTNNKWYHGHTGYTKAMQLSDQNETPAIIYMRTDWCQYCKKFEKELLTNYEVNTSLAKFIKIKINPEHSDQDKRVYQKLKGKGYPTLIFQHGANGKPIHVRAPYTRNGNNWKLMKPNEFIRMLNQYGT